VGEKGFEFRGVAKRFGQQTALSDLSLQLPPGRHTALLGPSGCGKTTALRLLAGLEVPSAGEVLLDGEVISDARGAHLPPHRRRLTLVFQDLALWPNLTAIENVRLGLSGLRLGRKESMSRAREALEQCGIHELSARKPSELSGGQQQRVALARAVAPRPDFLLLDEPFAALDLVIKARLVDELRQVAEARQITVVLVTHEPLDALSLCDWSHVLDDGRVQESGPLRDLLKNPRSTLLRLFRDRAMGGGETDGGDTAQARQDRRT
jgi:ABC-type Fe3+/spermidine/putrescine transport system ATPase subunit